MSEPVLSIRDLRVSFPHATVVDGVGFDVMPGEPAELRFGVAAPATARPGSRWWALAKVMYFGRVRYSQAIPINIVAG